MGSGRTVLIDNATLSGVERITGESKTINLNNFENDVLCLEKLITAILFSDRIISVDDYKESYRSERLRRFNFVDFLRADAETYADISGQAASFAKEMIFSFDGSRPAGDVVSFFEALRISPQRRWDVFVSSEYLTLSLLVPDTRDIGYETAIDSIFRSESANAEAVLTNSGQLTTVKVDGRSDVSDLKDLVQIFRDGNANFSGHASRSLLGRLIFGYGWAAERSYFYNAIAERERADAYLAPLRDAFCESCCRLESTSQVNGLLESLKTKSQETLAKIVDASGRAKFAIKLPFFTAYLISICDTPRQCIERALELRSDADFKSSRALLQNLQHLDSANRYQEINGILKMIEQNCTTLLKRYSVTTGNGIPVSLSLGITGISAEFGIKLDRLFTPYRNRPFARIFRNIAQEMLTVERLGALNDKLRSSIKQHKDSGYPNIAVTPRFMEHRDNEYGRPADPSS